MSSFMRGALAAAVLWSMAALSASAASSAASAAQSRPGELPEGEGRDVVEAICSNCHGLDQVAAQRRTRGEWEYLVEDMASRAGAGADDIKAIVGYVVAHFGRANVNNAPESDLVVIVDLTQAEATAIVEYRKKEGDYRTLEDLRKVPALDFARIQARKDRIVFTGS